MTVLATMYEGKKRCMKAKRQHQMECLFLRKP